MEQRFFFVIYISSVIKEHHMFLSKFGSIALLLGITLAVGGTLYVRSAAAALEVGNPAPNFKLKSAVAGEVSEFSLAESLKTGPVVLYFFPAAFTAGCNREAHSFAEHIEDFKALNATVIGVSNDTIETIAKFSVQECAGKFTVAADPESKVISAYGVKFPVVGKAQRVSYLIGKDGKIAFIFNSLTDTEGHIENTLKALKGLK
jgi:peroxiredoxin (alkyl hydroperoxide reductase subunit C)